MLEYSRGILNNRWTTIIIDLVAPFGCNFLEKEPETGMATFSRPFLGKISRVEWDKIDGDIEDT